MSAFQVGRRDDILGTIGVGDETVEAVAAMQALDGVVEPSKSGKMLTSCRWLQQRRTSLQIVAQNCGAPEEPTLTKPAVAGGNDVELSLSCLFRSR